MSGVAWVGDVAGYGRLVEGPSVPAGDRGLSSGYGVFETVRVLEGGRIPLWERHAARLRTSAAALGLPVPDTDALREAGAELIARAGSERDVLRVTVTAGEGAGRCILTTRARVQLDRPVRLATVRTGRGDRDPTAAHKTTSRMFWVLAQREAEAAGADEALVLLDDDVLAETTNGNVFAELDGSWVTPPADGRILPGVARAVLLEGMQAAGRPCAERPIRPSELRADTRVAVSNAVHGPRPAVVDGGAGGDPVPGLSDIWTAALGI